MTPITFTHRIRKIISVIGIAVAMTSASRADLLFTDHFSYTDGANLGATTGGGGNTWSVASGDVSQIKIAVEATQTSPSGFATASGLGVEVIPTGTRKQTGVPFNSVTGIPVADGNIVFASFLLNFQTLPGSGNMRVAYLHNGAASAGGIEVVVSSTGQVGVQKKGSGTTFISGTPLANTNTTHLIVMRYKFQTGNDEVAVWADPASTNYGVNPAPTAGALTVGGGSDMSVAIINFFIDAPAVTGPVFWIDEVRVATTWAEAVPSTAGVSTNNANPVITQAMLAPQGMLLRGTNGTPSSGYQVITSTNLALAASNWPAVGNYSFDGAGNFDSTNPVQAGAGRQFFRLLVGATNPPASAAPSITNQPQSLTVAVGDNANFTVGVNGTVPLNYFWSFNTNTPVGSNNSTLSLANVTTNDAGGYRVIITNNTGAATSSVAMLTVLIPPSITAQPTNLTITAGSSAVFNVTATGSAPLRYQWCFNTNSALANATNATLTLNSINATNAGAYSVIVTNAVGAVTSSIATLTVVGPPVISTQPQSLSVTVSNDATFSVTAAGTAPLAYRWFFNTNTLIGGNSNSFARINAQIGDAGTYSVIITNNYGAVTSSFAALTISTALVNFAQFNLVGFAETTTGGGQLAESSPFYVKVTNALDLANAVKSSTIKVIEVTTNLNLGWLEIGAPAQAVGPFRQHAIPSLHPVLIQAGVSLLDIQKKDGLTIFSTNGATIKHACFNIKNARNIIVRNLKFDEMWEWDEATKGNYDSKDFDFIDLGNGGGTGTTTNIWIDHCTFTKAYDGICDIKGGANHITFSWNKYMGDDGDVNPNSFVWQQINSLESNKVSYAFYNFLRNNGFSTTNIATILHGHDKTHLMGATALTAENDLLSATFHHQWYMNPWDRLPRLRGGNVHNYNIFADDSAGLDAKRMRDSIAAAMSSGNQTTLNNTYNFQIFLNGSISTENGAILVENSIYQDCITPLRNNQTDVNNPTYTGKVMALNSIYTFRTTGGTTNTYTGSSTNAPGDTYFGPVQAPTIPFSWNLPGGVLPYNYTMTDPNQLKSVLTNATTGCGAGVLTWAKTNWLKTTY